MLDFLCISLIFGGMAALLVLKTNFSYGFTVEVFLSHVRIRFFHIYPDMAHGGRLVGLLTSDIRFVEFRVHISRFVEQVLKIAGIKTWLHGHLAALLKTY